MRTGAVKMGPNLVVDKSVLQAVTTLELGELSAWFEIVCIPTLLNEIIADLRLTNPRGRVPEDVVALLAHRMNQGGATLESIDALDLAYTEFMTNRSVPMEGSVPVAGPQVKSSIDGKYVLYDSTVQQRMWSRLASKQFDDGDIKAAEEWRSRTGKMDLPALRHKWKPFVTDTLGNPPASIEAIVRAIDNYMSTREVSVQQTLFGLVCDMLLVEDAYRIAGKRELARQKGPTRLVRDLRPYCMSILRLILTYLAAIARGAWGERQTDEIDLQYLFYTPFCLAFASFDKFHHAFWPAATPAAGSRGYFLRGSDLRPDLQKRMKRRAEMTAEDWRQHRLSYGHHPWPVPNSPIETVYQSLGEPRPYDPDKRPQIDQAKLNEMIEHFRDLR